MKKINHHRIAIVLLGMFAFTTACSEVKTTQPPPLAKPGGAIVVRTAAVENEDPYKAGRSAAQALHKAMGQTAPSVIVMTECYDDKALKQKALAGVASVFPGRLIVGAANYGSFTQAGSLDFDSVSLMAIGGDGIAARIALVDNMGAAGLSLETQKDQLAGALRTAGAKLAGQLPRTADAKMMIVFADAHSPKNQFLIEGVQQVTGKQFPIVGGSVCKNQGMTWLYYNGKMHGDSAVAVMLYGDFDVSLAGRQAKSNDKVIATAREGAAEVVKNLKGEPVCLMAFNCGGRLGKLDDPADELRAIQASVGKQLPIYGNYFAGEFGPADAQEKTDALCSGRGWHVMFALLGR